MKALHRLALRAYPPALRVQFGAELQHIFEDRLAGARSPLHAAVVGVFLIGDAIVSGLAERRRMRRERRTWPGEAWTRASRGQIMTWESIRADVRFALRQMRAAPLFALLTVGSLALGIGANSAMFGVVNAVLLEPLPYRDPGSLITIWSDNSRNAEPMNPVSPANFQAFRAAPSLSQVEAFYSFLTPLQARVGSDPEVVLTAQVTPGMFALLGRSPAIGTTFTTDAADAGVVLSHRFWQRRFSGDPAVVGRTIQLVDSETPVAILGVMPPDFTFPYGSMLAASGFTRELNVDMWRPMSRARDPRLVDAAGQPNRAIHYFAVIGRLQPGASVARARGDLTAIAARRAQEFPETNDGWGVTVRPLHDQTVGSIRPALLILLAGIGIVLLITCMNVANVLLARAAGRARDLSIRSALGASGARLIQQTLTESMLLAVAGGIAGMGITTLVMRAIIALAPGDLPRLGEARADIDVLLFALGLSIGTGIVVGLLPALSAARSRAQDSLRDGTRATASPARRRMRATLIVAEVAMAMILTACGGLLLRSFVAVVSVDPGFRADHLLTMQVSVPSRSAEAPAALAFYDDLESRLRALPGVVAVGGTTRLPLGSTHVTTMLEVEGRAVPRASLPEVEMRRALFDYFTAMQIPIVRGRGFTTGDGPDAPRVAVINSALADRVFAGMDPIGQRVRFGAPTAPWLRIVGVVGNIRHGSLEELPRPELYISYRQGPPSSPYVVIRSDRDAAALAAPVRQVLRDLGAVPPSEVRTMDAIRSRSVGGRRFILLLVGTFGVLALGLAGLGVFGVITLIAAERTSEVGIRLALGAAPSHVFSLLLSHALKLAAAGVVLGGLGALAVAPVMRAQIFGISAADPVTFAVVSLALLMTAVAAAYLPARRAMRVDPVTALRR